MAENSFLVNALIEVAPLACYVLYIFFSFCDGFGLKPLRKIIWAIYFLLFSAISFIAIDSFDLTFIVPLSSMMAFILAWFQKKENQQRRLG